MAQGVTGYIDIGDSTYSPSRLKLRIHYSESYDVSTNKSVVSITKIQAMSVSPYSWYGVTYYPGGTISIGGVTAITMDSTKSTHAVSIQKFDTWYDFSGALGSVTVDHNSDGTKTVAISAAVRYYTKSGGAGSGANLTGSQNVALTTIARASVPTVSAASAAMGSSLTIYTNRKAAFTHTLRCIFGGAETTIATGVGDSYTWSIPYDLANKIPALPEDNAVIYCDTYNGSTNVGTESVSVKLTVPDNATTKPTLNPTAQPTGTLPAAFAGKYVQGKTGVQVSFGAASVYSTIAKCTMTIGSTTYPGNPATCDLLTVSGDVSIVCTVTDARGYSSSKTISISVLEYSIPRVTNASCTRCNSAGTPDSGGAYVHLKFTKVFSSVGGVNTCSVARQHKPDGGSYGAETDLTAENSFEQNIPGIATDPDKAYQVRLILRDAMGETVYVVFDLPSQFHTIHLKAGGKGIAFGKKATEDKFVCAMDAEFQGDVKFKIPPASIIFAKNLAGGSGTWAGESIQIDPSTRGAFLVTASCTSGGVLCAIIVMTYQKPQVVTLSASSECDVEVSDSGLLTMKSKWWSTWNVIKLTS